MKLHGSLKGWAALLAGVALFSTIEVCSKFMETGGAVAGRYPFWLAFFRFMIAGLLLVILLHFRGVRLAPKAVAELTGLGLLGVTLMSSLYHLSITFLPANVAALVFSCNPVFVMVLAPLLLPERFTGRKLLAIMLSLGGIGVLAMDQTDGISLTGLLLMLAAIIVFAFYTVLFKKMTPRYGALTVTGTAALAGGIFLLPLAVLSEGLPVAAYGMIDWGGILYLALVGTALAYFLYIYGMGHVEAGWGSMSFFLKPFLAAVFAWFLLGEALSLPMLIGGGFILGSMAVGLIPARKKSNSRTG